MKKLLLLLLIAPTLILAEEFSLVCECEQTKTIDGKNEIISNEQFIIQVKDEILVVDNDSWERSEKYTNTQGSDAEFTGEIKYKKDLYMIEGSMDAVFTMSSCAELKIKNKIEINRISRNISMIKMMERSDICKKENKIMNTNIKGKCKKQQRAF